MDTDSIVDTTNTITRIDLHPLGGIAGDMFAAALFDAFPSLYQRFLSDLACLQVDGLSVVIEERLTSSLQAKHFSVIQKTSVNPPRTLQAVKIFLQDSELDVAVQAVAVGIFSLLAEAEAQVHGKTVDTIHFHEVSDWDSMVDILAAAGIICRLSGCQWRVGELPLGAGTVRTAHGDIPIPAPATMALLKGFQWIDDGVPGERVTPTGAAILAYLQATPCSTAVGSAVLITAGSGCGSKTLADRANILRAAVFADDGAGSEILSDVVTNLSFEVDDMTAEEIGWAAESLREVEGVLDLSCIAMQAKKGRLSTGFRILVLPDFTESVIRDCLSKTSTLGVRYNSVNRKILSRTFSDSQGVEVKVVVRPDKVVTAKAASDDLSGEKTLAARRYKSHETVAKVVSNSGESSE